MRITLLSLSTLPLLMGAQEAPSGPALPTAGASFAIQESGCLGGCEGDGDSATASALCLDLAISVTTRTEVSNGTCKRIPLYPAGAETCAQLGGCQAVVSRSWGIGPGQVVHLFSVPPNGVNQTITDPAHPPSHMETVSIDCNGSSVDFYTMNLTCDLSVKASASCSLCPETP